ncbi:MAG: hypothetical protein ACOC1X_01785 [Promethearchaeota archaeon]
MKPQNIIINKRAAYDVLNYLYNKEYAHNSKISRETGRTGYIIGVTSNLERLGLLKLIKTGNKSRKTYKITDKGKEVMQNLLKINKLTQTNRFINP